MAENLASPPSSKTQIATPTLSPQSLSTFTTIKD